ncbi:sulfurtransferase complex subunit TusC [Litoribrevibacter euphylliae]|uniref:Sulfurtransferase complex subunit TusC n=1 Tax=Litoribrevibacter euphylliae TaxID=1834034 RepID=A0ABV7HGP3_9GAMM
MKKNIVIIIRSAPYGSSSARDAVDFILTAAAYEQDISVVFQGDGVFQLLKDQNPSLIHQKRISALISAFEMYEVDQVFYDLSSLSERNINKDDLINNLVEMELHSIQELLNKADTVLTF